MISVVISTHNRSDRLKRAIQSVLDQTYQDFEIIVSDDASTDNTKEVVQSFKDRRITYHRLTKNFGNDTKPKNEGIKLAQGEYIALLDDDNEYRKDHLSALIKEMPEYDVVYGDRFIYADDKPVQPGIFHEPDPFLMMRRNYIDTSDVLVKREALIDLGGFDERYKKYVDWNLWVRMFKAGKTFKRVPLVITNYHVYPDSKSNRKEDEKEFMVPAWNAMDCDVRVPYLRQQFELTSASGFPRVAIYSITHDRLEYTNKCFQSIKETAGYKFDHFVVDNGSVDGTVEWIRDEYKPAWHKFNEDNKGISIASNQAIKKIKEWENGKFGKAGKKYDIIVKVDNDALFLTKDWLKKMVEIWKANNMIVMSCYIQGLKDNPGGAPREEWGMIKDEYVGLTRHIGGICHFVDAHAYDGFRWDEKSVLHGVQDLEFSNYLRGKGYLHAYLENYICEHIDGTEGQQTKFPEYFERRKFEKTHAYGES